MDYDTCQHSLKYFRGSSEKFKNIEILTFQELNLDAAYIVIDADFSAHVGSSDLLQIIANKTKEICRIVE